MATDYGTDVATFPDLDLTFSPMSGTRVMVESCARRLLTPRGSLLGSPDYGIDLRAALLDVMDKAAAEGVKTAIEQELLKDERIASVTADVQFDFATSTLTVKVAATLSSASSFAFTLNVSNLDVTLLQTS